MRKAWHKLSAQLYNLPVAHLARILNLGFCLSSSPKSLAFSSDRAQFTVCHGLNEPDSDIVFLHTPNETDIELRMRTLRSLIRQLPEKPRLVTLCRSVRDGYTPRSLAGVIEAGIFRIFEDAKIEERFGSWEVLYDDDLFGGIAGWNGRTWVIDCIINQYKSIWFDYSINLSI